jgi:hypothetical protein
MTSCSAKLAATITQSCLFEKRPHCQTVCLALRAPKARSNSATISVENAAVRAPAR